MAGRKSEQPAPAGKPAWQQQAVAMHATKTAQQAAEQPGREEDSQQARKLIATPMSEIKARPFPTDTIDGVLPQTGIAVLGGASGDGKSFIALDLGAHIAFGLDWFGRKVKAARPVCYFYLENPAGIKQRILAWEQHNSRTIDDACGYQFFEMPLDMGQDVEELADILPPASVCLIDTLHASNPSVNENSPEGMGEIIARMKKLAYSLRKDVLVLVVHHVPKTSTQAADSRNRLAGHYSLPADTDAVLLTERKGNDRSLWIGKAREGEDGVGFSFSLEPYVVGTREDGSEVTSLAVKWTGKPIRAARRKMPDAEQYGREALKEVQDIHKGSRIPFEDWQSAFMDNAVKSRPDEKLETTKRYFRLARKILTDSGVIKIEDGKFVDIQKSLEE